MLADKVFEPFCPYRFALFGGGFFGENEAIGGVSASCWSFFVACCEFFARVFANRFQHREPRFAVGLRDLLDQAFIHHRSHAVEQIQVEVGFRVADGFDTFEGASAGEDGEAPEEFLLGGAEQIVTPVDRGAQSLLTLRKVASATRKQLKAAGEARAHGSQGENLHARGC